MGIEPTSEAWEASIMPSHGVCSSQLPFFMTIDDKRRVFPQAVRETLHHISTLSLRVLSGQPPIPSCTGQLTAATMEKSSCRIAQLYGRLDNSRSLLHEEAVFASNCNQDRRLQTLFLGKRIRSDFAEERPAFENRPPRADSIRGRRSYPRASRDVDEMTSPKHSDEHQR